MEVVLVKTMGGWVNGDGEAEKLHRRTKLGGSIHSNFFILRNARFHRKLFSLLRFAYDLWEPGEVSDRHGVPVKNFEQFREDVTILAGYFEVHYRLDGSTRYRAKSISWAKMDDAEFEKLYQAVIDVLVARIPAMLKMSAEEIEETVIKIIMYA